MTQATQSPVDVSAPPERDVFELRGDDGQLLRRLPADSAKYMVSRGWAEWIGTGRRRYARLTGGAPLSSRSGILRRAETRLVRGDQKCTVYANGQQMGSLREFVREAKQ